MILLADADVLIDYRDADLDVLAVVSERLAPLAVLTPVLRQVKGVGEAHCRRLGIELVVPEIDELLEAGQVSAGLGFEDALCLVVARSRGWTCVSNDRRLLAVCAQRDVPTRRGLQLMIELVVAGALTRRKALAVAKAIHVSNPAHINTGVLAEFERRVLGSE